MRQHVQVGWRVCSQGDRQADKNARYFDKNKNKNDTVQFTCWISQYWSVAKERCSLRWISLVHTFVTGSAGKSIWVTAPDMNICAHRNRHLLFWDITDLIYCKLHARICKAINVALHNQTRQKARSRQYALRQQAWSTHLAIKQTAECFSTLPLRSVTYLKVFVKVLNKCG
jgi:hypothetical protein